MSLMGKHLAWAQGRVQGCARWQGLAPALLRTLVSAANDFAPLAVAAEQTNTPRHEPHILGLPFEVCFSPSGEQTQSTKNLDFRPKCRRMPTQFLHSQSGAYL
jgi:hypothetical protein